MSEEITQMCWSPEEINALRREEQEEARELEHVLIFPDRWGPASVEQVEELKSKHSIFPCGCCSTAEIQVYHNLIGQHHHTANIAERLKEARSQ